MALLALLLLTACASAGVNAKSGTRGASPPATTAPAKATPSTSAAASSLKPTASPTPPPGPPLRIELWGDSIAAQAAPYFGYFAGLTGHAIAREHTFGGSALCDWFADMRSELDPSSPSGFHPQIAVIQFSGDAFTPCMRDAAGVAFSGQGIIDKYASDSATAIALFTAAKVPVYFVTTPISRGQAAQGLPSNPLAPMFRNLPARYRTNPLVRFADAAAAVEWHGHYTDTLPCQKGETCTGHWPDGTATVVVRQADGTHFCPVKEVMVNGSTSCPSAMPGARRYVQAIIARIAQDFPSLRLPG